MSLSSSSRSAPSPPQDPAPKSCPARSFSRSATTSPGPGDCTIRTEVLPARPPDSNLTRGYKTRPVSAAAAGNRCPGLPPDDALRVQEASAVDPAIPSADESTRRCRQLEPNTVATR